MSQTMQNEFRSTVTAWISSHTDTKERMDCIWLFNDVYNALKEGITHFWFFKTDGTLRSAYGTLNQDIIERHGGIPKKKKGPEKTFSGAVSYFDLEKDEWRSFKANAIKMMDHDYDIVDLETI